MPLGEGGDDPPQGDKTKSLLENVIKNTNVSDLLPGSINPPKINPRTPSGMHLGPDDPIFKGAGVQKPKVPFKFDPIGPFGVEPDQDFFPSQDLSQFNPTHPFSSEGQPDVIGPEGSITGEHEGRGVRLQKFDNPDLFSPHGFNRRGFPPNQFPF